MAYVKRNFNAHDFYLADFICDSQWHYLDLSDIEGLPANTLLHVRYEHKANVDDTLVKYRDETETGEYNNICNKAPVKNVWHYEEGWILSGSNKKIQYKVPSTVTGCTLMIKGWLI